MPEMKTITKYLDGYLESSKIKNLTAVMANQILEKAGILNDTRDRPGKPIRELLRQYELPHGFQDNKRHWYLPHSSSFEKGSLKNKIREIAFEINTEIQIRQSRLSLLQELRAKKYNLKKTSKSFFNLKGIKPKYSFHNGGINEIQFNFGFERIGNEKYFRYGIAFNLRRGQSLHNPMEIFANKIKNFNQFLNRHKNHLGDLSMWYYDVDEIRQTIGHPINIDRRLGTEGNFIFIGKLLKKDPLKVNGEDVNEIVNLFDRLMPLYEFVEFGTQVEIESRIARICWNKNGWVKPSGREGKSKTESHERDYGFGYEEWLLDRSKYYKGYCYGFLQPIFRYRKKYIGKRLNILLYSIDGFDNKRYWIGELKNVEVIDDVMQKEVYEYYLKENKIDDMVEQLNSVGIKTARIKKSWEKYGINPTIRFKPEEIKGIFEKPIPIKKNNKFIKTSRYVLLKVDNVSDINHTISESGFDPNSGSTIPPQKSKKNPTRSSPQEIEIPQTHNQILRGFMLWLQQKYPRQRIAQAVDAHGGTKIDLVRNESDGSIFYEIKSYKKLITSLRVALGQLLEYCCYPNNKYAKSIVLVSDLEADEDMISYIKHLNTILEIPLGYIQFDLNKNIVVQQI
ncbi:MAG: hypothetical protein IPM56_02975 [Ignavibacteriales bacterium]|nr:MAG: hypothetical protein IPM56_02975 [Ignavibacteriales bacterium]